MEIGSNITKSVASDLIPFLGVSRHWVHPYLFYLYVEERLKPKRCRGGFFGLEAFFGQIWGPN
jgi:hypothetical protein